MEYDLHAKIGREAGLKEMFAGRMWALADSSLDEKGAHDDTNDLDCRSIVL